ncbi:50S ribosomal protein HLP, mitochondrial [Citrus clementina]|uniref:50S ribosomal protein HLP, mitochondrial n=1 Tax=Citrus clementina TaxID=85681 RepID=UPI000CED3239|nr:50S ribosomal protein HLP, mitochondrial [Citrus x clementina]
MAASLASKWSRGVGRALFGGLGNNLSGLLAGTFHEKGASSTFLSRGRFVCFFVNLQRQQQRRSFIQMGTVMKVADNSGAKTVTCIHPARGKKVARLGDTIIASVKELHQKKGERILSANNKGDHNAKAYKVKKAVVVCTAMPFSRCDGSVIKFDENAIALLNKHQDYRITKKRNLHKGRRAGRPIRKRVFGPVPYELRKKWMLAVLTLAEDNA